MRSKPRYMELAERIDRLCESAVYREFTFYDWADYFEGIYPRNVVWAAVELLESDEWDIEKELKKRGGSYE